MYIFYFHKFSNSTGQSFSEASSSPADQDIPPRFMEPEGSLPYAQKLSACPRHEPDEFFPCPSNPMFWYPC
jgi:hypothetical protein